MRQVLAALLVLAFASPRTASAFCGFYVGKADSKLYNKASQVVLARDGDRTVISMANDYKGELSEFALVVPVPVVLKKEQIHVGEHALIEHLDAYSAPRLVEYFDENPCERRMYGVSMLKSMAAPAAAGGAADSAARAKALGVTVEARYTVGEYDIVILGAKQSDGLETWLTENGYNIPTGASAAIKPYIQQKMKFFVAKVNLTEQAKIGVSSLRPLQFAYEDPRFMLPIRLGMINADGPQDLIIYVLTRSGRVETTNYRTVKVPSDQEIPEYVKDAFGDFYKAAFSEAYKREDRRAVFTEYFWNMGWCDPCAADPLTRDELRRLGVFWVNDNDQGGGPGKPMPFRGGPWRPGPVPGGALPVMVTRLHVRYDAEHFPEDLVFQQTADQANFQGRYILRHPWTGRGQCPEAVQYEEQLKARHRTEAETLAHLTGWNLADISKKMSIEVKPEEAWYKDIFR